jgi:hypothetical protein
VLDARAVRGTRRSRHVLRHIVAHRKNILTGTSRKLGSAVLRIDKLQAVRIAREIQCLNGWWGVGASLFEVDNRFVWLELERERGEKDLGDWPFEIGLWVGRAATPNEMGSKDRDHPDTARRRTIAFWNDDRKPSPIPLEDCPWCGTKFTRSSFRLVADGKSNRDYPKDLQIWCANRDCAFSGGRALPIVAVDDPIYRRLPCFVIATVDKFAGMPWTGPVGALFGRVERYDKDGFYGPCESGKGAPLPNGSLLPPDLIIQDELHLISGPLGTIVGLYETALEELACRDNIRPKIVPTAPRTP